MLQYAYSNELVQKAHIFLQNLQNLNYKCNGIRIKPYSKTMTILI